MAKKFIYYFSEGSDAFAGDKVTMKNILGGKGAGLAEMTAAGMPVPQGFTITTEACTQYYADNREINDAVSYTHLDPFDGAVPRYAGSAGFRLRGCLPRREGCRRTDADEGSIPHQR